ncbi:RNA methyltransferase [Lachnospiraceae bacterium OttesenSCG-928-E19]|nr:RNA methyltransferase [Lachnospiraceae bacterium OttesenSCG-928-E19]
MITSTANAKIKHLVQLQKKHKTRQSEGVFVVEGARIVREIPQERLVEVYVSESFREGNEEIPKEVPVEVIADHVFRHVSETKTPQGIMGVVRMDEKGTEAIINHPKAHILILDNLQDPGNLGTIFRTAEAAGVTGVVMSKDCVDIYNPKVIRSTMGAIFRMPFYYASDLILEVEKIKQAGVRVYAAHLAGEKNYDEVNYLEKTAFMLGNEGNGLRPEIAEMAEEYIRIPMEGKVESLNVAIAGTVLMFEVSRQRRRK